MKHIINWITYHDYEHNERNDWKKLMEKLSNSTHRIETASHGPVEESGYPIDTLNPP
jgi:hypothetical protein